MVIVESPAKAKTIGKYLGKDFFVRASAGHVKDLPPRALGVDIKDDFRPTYRVIPGKEKILAGLRKEASKVESIYLAADPDREGEAICYHLAQELNGKGNRKIHRVLFNEITKQAILRAFEKPLSIDRQKVEAQQARRILDRIVGYKVSPLLWKKVRKGLSAGRVQTVAVRLIVDREREIRAFEPEEYWDFKALLEGSNPPPFEAKASKHKGKKFNIDNQQDADALFESLKDVEFRVSKVTRKERKRKPVPPFITSQLQQDAVRRLGFSVKKTMTLAQRLYEGVEIGSEGAVGLITYMRTDSTRVADSALEEVRTFVEGEFGKKYLPSKAIRYRSKKGAQDAHEAIRPTFVQHTPESVKSFLGRDELKLYTLIWKRFVASQMNPAIFDQTQILVEAGETEFKATGSILKFDGFLRLYRSSEEEEAAKEDGEEGNTLPEISEGELLKVKDLQREQKFTQPPRRFNEASLVKALEEKGIGRPSTYQQILSVIMSRDYVAKDAGKFIPTELGEVVNDLLVGHFKDIFDYDYTAKLEQDLDEIEEGKEDWVDALNGFYEGFKTTLESAKSEMKNLKREEIPTDEECDKCGKNMVIRWGKFGRFLACSDFPKCRNTRELQKDPSEPEERTANEVSEECSKCGQPMVVKKGRFGEFLACSGYPSCKNTKRIMRVDGEVVAPPEKELDEECPKCGSKLVKKMGRFGEFTACGNYPDCRYIKPVETGVDCPECDGGAIVEKKSRRGKVFYGCNRYPECEFVLWQKPIPEECPECGAPFVVEKTTKKEGTVRFCRNKECGFRDLVTSEGSAAEVGAR